jgi:hypothetical protein
MSGGGSINLLRVALAVCDARDGCSMPLIGT